MMKQTKRAKALFVFAFVAFTASSLAVAQSENDVVRWKTIEGNITAAGVDNPVAGISTGTLPWTTTRGRARVDLSTGAASFEVDGLVLNGGNGTGSTGPVDQVEGSLVCNAGTNTQAVLTTSPVPLSSTGDAEFSGNIGNVPSPCANPLFLVRIGPDLPGANQKWIATGAVRRMGHDE